ncbi:MULTISPECIES: hypothetical protein [Staphylococcaceae]|uniref:Uncharacterized protein n=1 Tax=Staphylococcus equorum TaxID=246432 RepID=A0AAP7LV78_9STAP|nr:MULTISPECIES: hypothetical protein [Staphylococcaceae]OEK59118.1 hypothetical protein ASS94_00190 [Staphylococcus equorum]
MSSRTAIFKEVAPNKFEGIYVHSDGYVEYTGEMLIKYYQEKNDILDVIREKKPITRIGSLKDVVNAYGDKEKYLEVNEDDLPKYTATHFVKGESEYRYYQAQSWEEIKDFNYSTHDQKGDVQGYVHKGEFIAYMGSGNNGYLYVQDINGEWFVSLEDESQREMTEFIPLEDEVERQSK